MTGKHISLAVVAAAVACVHSNAQLAKQCSDGDTAGCAALVKRCEEYPADGVYRPLVDLNVDGSLACGKAAQVVPQEKRPPLWYRQCLAHRGDQPCVAVAEAMLAGGAGVELAAGTAQRLRERCLESHVLCHLYARVARLSPGADMATTWMEALTSANFDLRDFAERKQAAALVSEALADLRLRNQEEAALNLMHQRCLSAEPQSFACQVYRQGGHVLDSNGEPVSEGEDGGHLAHDGSHP